MDDSFDNGGTLTPATQWISFPEETFVFTEEDWQAVRLLNALHRTIWAMTTAREAHGFPMIADVN